MGDQGGTVEGVGCLEEVVAGLAGHLAALELVQAVLVALEGVDCSQGPGTLDPEAGIPQEGRRKVASLLHT